MPALRLRRPCIEGRREAKLRMNRVVWLQLRRSTQTSQLKYVMKTALASATAELECGLLSGATSQSPVFQTKIEFLAKVPFRPVYRYRITATGPTFVSHAIENERNKNENGGQPPFIGVELQVHDLNKKSHDSWQEIEPGLFQHSRSGLERQILDNRPQGRPPLFPAPFIAQAFADAFDPSVDQYMAFALVGRRPSVVRIQVVENKGDELQLEVAAQSLDDHHSPAEVGFEQAHHFKATFSKSMRTVTRFELRLPVFGSVVFLLQPAAAR